MKIYFQWKEKHTNTQRQLSKFSSENMYTNRSLLLERFQTYFSLFKQMQRQLHLGQTLPSSLLQSMMNLLYHQQHQPRHSSWPELRVLALTKRCWNAMYRAEHVNDIRKCTMEKKILPWPEMHFDHHRPLSTWTRRNWCVAIHHLEYGEWTMQLLLILFSLPCGMVTPLRSYVNWNDDDVAR